MRTMGRLLLIVVPILAVSAFLLVQKQLGEIAPATPESAATLAEEAPPSQRTALRPPTVLEPQPAAEGQALPAGVTEFPPGVSEFDWQPSTFSQREPHLDRGDQAVVPIPDLQTPELPLIALPD